MPKRFEYKVFDTKDTARVDVQLDINNLGEEGWELVTSYPHRYQNQSDSGLMTVSRFIFKREKTEG